MTPTCTRPVDSSHCCYLNGEVCQFLDLSGKRSRCTIYADMPNQTWEDSPAGRWFAAHHPGYTCRDWPQNIPGLLDRVRSGEINPSVVSCWGGS